MPWRRRAHAVTAAIVAAQVPARTSVEVVDGPAPTGPGVGDRASSTPTNPAVVSSIPAHARTGGRRRMIAHSAIVVETMLLVIVLWTRIIGPRLRARTCRASPPREAIVPAHHQGRRISAATSRGSPAANVGTERVARCWATLALPSSAAAVTAVAVTAQGAAPIRTRSPGVRSGCGRPGCAR